MKRITLIIYSLMLIALTSSIHFAWFYYDACQKLEQENESLKMENKSLHWKVGQVIQENRDFRSENSNLKEKIKNNNETYREEKKAIVNKLSYRINKLEELADTNYNQLKTVSRKLENSIIFSFEKNYLITKHLYQNKRLTLKRD